MIPLLADSCFCPTCGYASCVCTVRKVHAPDCKLRKAMECRVSIECDHGRDVCPVCDPCTCAARDNNPFTPAGGTGPS